MSSTSQQVDDQAAKWAALRDLGLTSAQEVEFERWLKADRRHLGAYARAEGALIRVERAHGWAREITNTIKPVETPVWTRRRILMTGSAAAGIAAVGVIGAGVWNALRDTTIATGKGEIRQVLLADGSVVKLNTNSKVAIEYTPELRKIKLLRGEALFDVAKNKKRPFVVEANGTLVRAVGTSFTVSALPERPVRVLVKEGVVELKRADVASSAPVRVSANTLALAPKNAPITATPVAQARLARNLAWEYGRLAFDDETLEDAAKEYARYSDIQIVVDPAVANMTITGSFVSNDPVGFAKSAASALDLQVDVNGQEVKIFRRTTATR
ncbi:transmembrane sensor [Rhizomicrobium palustre]|uniref:Transmembrane sensor n=1 Tax=Rhizomicrobium palustre TaxID=189966 RepID=A0A846MVD6_9PROT|nr:FecR domain-containing protein [Rhizomicrobium palustre]NIK87434.1 transmembrane sensor [Rhizomicrobium palustre]